MSNLAWERVEAVFSRVVDLPSPERTRVLVQECGDDVRLLAKVSSLLEADARAAEFMTELERSPAEMLEQIHSSNDKSDLAGTVVGSYKLVRRLGQGGMGCVYLGERIDGEFTKSVAVKIIRPNGNTDFNRDRFIRERQILAALEHPNIGRLLDGGTTDDGLPYLIMELVDGSPLPEFCRRHGLTVKERVDLFLRVCDAVSHAHSRGVIHRDIKPSNILVDKAGHPKLLDFGIAKITRNFCTEGKLTTGPLVHMTPDYASPEQVNGTPITEASDIYSLGIVLYELVTDVRPYSVRSNSLYEIAKTICDEKVSSVPFVGAELERIILRCLEKQPEQRFRSVKDLANELRSINTESFERVMPAADIEQHSGVKVLPFEFIAVDETADTDGFERFRADLRTRLQRHFSHSDELSNADIAESLPNAERVVEGSIVVSADRLRVKVNLFDTRSNSVVWAEKFDGVASDLNGLQDRVFEEVTTIVAGNAAVTGSEHPRPTVKPDVDTGRQMTAAASNKKFRPALIAAAAGAVLVAVAAFAFFRMPTKILPSPPLAAAKNRRVVEIAPFAGLSEGDFLASSLEKQLGNGLGRNPSVSVVWLGENDEPHLSAKDADAARYVLNGTVAESASGRLLSVELKNAGSGEIVWKEKFSAERTDLPLIVNRVSERILNVMAVEAGTQTPNKEFTHDAMAYECYLRGRFALLRRSSEAFKTALKHFDNAINLDPNFALPYTGRADVYFLMNSYSSEPGEDLIKQAETNALRALTIDPELAEAHASYGAIKSTDPLSTELAETHFRRAIELNPSYAPARHWFAHFLMNQGRNEEALSEIENAIRAEPRSSVIHSNRAVILHRLGRNDEASQSYDRAIELDRENLVPYLTKSAFQQRTGDYDGAVRTIEQVKTISPSPEVDAVIDIMKAQASANRGDSAGARAKLRAFLGNAKFKQSPAAFASDIAVVYLLLGDTDNAFRWLGRVKNPMIKRDLSEDVRFRSLMNDARFVKLVDQRRDRSEAEFPIQIVPAAADAFGATVIDI